ncbi:transmembrane sensor [Paenochrobactrum gallinarii]|uniref:Transmembrane sensor n=1 Tax=Paenochrobactrum gallinarii TaxID=643673 RepID=A0A841LUP8_9HYPH|nr:FecR family protein [Paenochrobactrum gallinarii]MBB6261853.1 transmembrane sensor [Paenochrobactrum gallinarii]
MLNINSSEKRNNAAIEDAAKWFVRMSNQPVSTVLQKSFQQWLDESPLHFQAYQQTEQLWQDLHAPAREAARSGWHRRKQQSFFTFMPAFKWASLAAILVMLTTAGALWRDAGLLQRGFADYAAAPGSYSEFTLSDGSHVYLDGDSAINEKFSPDERHIELIRGRAWFDVTRIENRPFKVTGGNARIQVLGTAFAVELEPDLTKVTVERGFVTVHASNFDASTFDDSINLQAGESASVAQNQIAYIDGDDTEISLAWKRGLIMMNQTPLKTVLEELSKYSSGRIVLHDTSLENLPVSGVFQTKNPDAVFDALRTTLKLTVVRVPGLMTIIYR